VAIGVIVITITLGRCTIARSLVRWWCPQSAHVLSARFPAPQQLRPYPGAPGVRRRGTLLEIEIWIMIEIEGVVGELDCSGLGAAVI
jgi:hypothetical protein